MIVPSGASDSIIMSHLSIKSCLVARIERAWSPEDSLCCPTARILRRLDTQAMPSADEVLCRGIRTLSECLEFTMERVQGGPTDGLELEHRIARLHGAIEAMCRVIP